MKPLALLILATSLSGCFRSDNYCPSAKIINHYNEISAIDDKVKQRVATFDQGLDKDLSEDENYLQILELKSQRDQHISELIIFRQGHKNCQFQGSPYDNQELNEELNQLQ